MHCSNAVSGHRDFAAQWHLLIVLPHSQFCLWLFDAKTPVPTFKKLGHMSPFLVELELTRLVCRRSIGGQVLCWVVELA
jgi:hypothetical protein